MFMEDLPLIILLIDDKAERAGLVAAGLEKASLTHIPSAAPEFLAKAVNKLRHIPAGKCGLRARGGARIA